MNQLFNSKIQSIASVILINIHLKSYYEIIKLNKNCAKNITIVLIYHENILSELAKKCVTKSFCIFKVFPSLIN